MPTTDPPPQVKGAPRLPAIQQSEGGSPPEFLQHVPSLGGSGFAIARDLVAFANQSVLHSHPNSGSRSRSRSRSRSPSVSSQVGQQYTQSDEMTQILNGKNAEDLNTSGVVNEEACFQKNARGRNFSQMEDIALCKAYVNASQNGAVGNDRQNELFWMEVKFKFDTLMSTESQEHQYQREWNSLRNRYKRVIQKSVSEWFPFYRRMFREKPSGVPQTDYMKKASEAFQASRKEQFNFEHCVPHLEDIPKFNPYVTPIHPGQALSEKTVNNTFAGLGSNLCRPIGRNKTKAIQRKNSSLTADSSDEAKVVFGSLVEVNEKIYQEMKRKNSIQERDLMIKNKWKLFSILDERGDERAEQILNELMACVDGVSGGDKRNNGSRDNKLQSPVGDNSINMDTGGSGSFDSDCQYTDDE